MKIKMYKNEMKINFEGKVKKEITWVEFENIDNLGKYLETIHKYKAAQEKYITKINKILGGRIPELDSFVTYAWDCKDFDIWWKK